MTQFHPAFSQSMAQEDSIVISIFVDISVQLTNTVFVNTTNISITIETAVLYRRRWEFAESCDDDEIIPKIVLKSERQSAPAICMYPRPDSANLLAVQRQIVDVPVIVSDGATAALCLEANLNTNSVDTAC